MVKIVITAPRGNMARLIAQEAYKRKNIQIIGAVGAPGRDYIGKDVGIVSGVGFEIGALVYDDIDEIIEKCDMVVDFSTVELSVRILESCIRHEKTFICGTTGFSCEQDKKMTEAADVIPMMKAANTSYVVNVMKKLLGEAAEKLGNKCKIEIIEMHSETKKDAPSGTAVEIAEEISEHSPDKNYEDIEIHSVRAGNTPSSHRVVFGCMGEKMEISHDAYDWRCYASGACDAVLFMKGKRAGLYTMEDVIEDNNI